MQYRTTTAIEEITSHNLSQVVVKLGKEKPILHHHPWLFSNSLERVPSTAEDGGVVKVVSSKGDFLAYAHFNKQSKIALRLLEWDEENPVNENWWRVKIKDAISRRLNPLKKDRNGAIRLVSSEADFLPGLIVDFYNGFLLVQFLTKGMENVRDLVFDELGNSLMPRGIIERSVNILRRLEGLESNIEHISGENPGNSIEFEEAGVKFTFNPFEEGHHPFHIDQKFARQISSNYFEGKKVLNCFSHTGEFSLHALKNGAAEVVSIDNNAKANEHYRKNLALNGFNVGENDVMEEDAFKALRHLNDIGRKFDVIIVNPPKFAPTKAYAEKAQRAYKDLHLHAMKNLAHGGRLIALSNSGGISNDQFKQVLSWAALDAKRQVQIVEQITHSSETPVRLSFPESEYLKGIVCEVI